MKIFSKKLLLYTSLLLVLSCGGGGDDSGGGTPPPAAVPDPSATSLIFPENNTECNEGVNLNDTQSTVTFRWENSENTDSYQVNLRNLNTNNISRANFDINEGAITIARGTPYEWFVVSMAEGTNVTASSPTERFFNQGPGIENFAPFPAQVINPTRGANLSTRTMVTLEWNGTDIDSDMLEYDVIFGTDQNPSEILDTITETTFDVNVNPGTTYFWAIVTRDSANNTSSSEVFQFLIQ